MKIKANWLGNKKKIFKQFFVSLLSYISYPFRKKNNKAAKKYFTSIYDKSLCDELIFDGNNSAYLDKVKILFSKDVCFNVVYDCGCGEGSFLCFMKLNHWKYSNYIGLDYAIKDKNISINEKILNADFVEYDFNFNGDNSLFVFVNVLCYLSNDEIETVLKKIRGEGKTLLIVEPIPGLFWDATFSGVRLYYRSIKKLSKLLNKYGFEKTHCSIDYMIKFKNSYMFPLSYAAIYNCRN